MNYRKTAPILMLALAACKPSPADKQADALENAAAQSDPAAAVTLERRADELRETEPDNADEVVQNALSEAGRTQAMQPHGE